MTDVEDNGFVPMGHEDDRPLGFDLDVLMIEKSNGGLDGPWSVAGVLARGPGQSPSWVGQPMQQEIEVPPDLAWEYWSEKVTNGHSYAVTGY